MSKTTLTFSKLPLHPLSRCEHPKILSCLLHRQRSEQLSSPIHLKSVKKFYALKVFLMLLLLSEFLKKTSNTYTLFPAKCRMKNLRIVCRSQTHYFFCKILRAQKRKKIWCVNSFNDQIILFLSFLWILSTLERLITKVPPQKYVPLDPWVKNRDAIHGYLWGVASLPPTMNISIRLLKRTRYS